ncbi:MAG TPA: isoprenylcysteine carboxylmethyltransferase family protein [Vicinamibacterales bacterium]
MNEDLAFRPLMIAGLVVILTTGLRYRIKSFASREPLDRRQEGVFILATLRPIALVLWLSVFAYLIHPAWLAWSSVPLPAWTRWTGVGVWAAAAALLHWTLSSLGPNLTDTVVTRQVHTLVTGGPYRWVRHPFYASVALLILALSLLAANWFFLLAGGTVVSLLLLRARREEALLVARFGDSYRGYMARTGRFLPRF